jgi:DNA-binding beta-propeller fold protein YncE
VRTVALAGNPTAIAVTNDGDRDDLDETVFVTQFFAEPVPGGPGITFDDGEQGVVWTFPSAGGAPAKIVLSPLANVGFTADRSPFCANFNANLHSAIYCPGAEETDPTADVIDSDPQGAFPNQLHAALLRDGLLYVPSIAASPEPPVKFNVNVQALVHVVDAGLHAEIPDRTVNLNAQIKLESEPAVPPGSFARLFANDVVALDATLDGSRLFFVSRGGNCVIQATLDANGQITLGVPGTVRYQTGNIPTGIAVSTDGKRAYTYNEVDFSVSALDLDAQTVIERDVSVGTLPLPGTFAHGVLLGKLAFHTALGLPESGIFGLSVRKIVPIDHRGKASLDGWSSCASCHPDGRSDNVTWIFGTGPRQTISLDAFFSKLNPADQRISNWSAVMGSITDFNNNARGVQGGFGFAGNPPPADIFQHGITEGASESLDAMTLWVQTVRTILPGAADPVAGAAGFSALRELPRRLEVDEEPGRLRQRPDLRRRPERRRRAARSGRHQRAGADPLLQRGRADARLPELGRHLRPGEPARDPRPGADLRPERPRRARLQRAVAARAALLRAVPARRLGPDARRRLRPPRPRPRQDRRGLLRAGPRGPEVIPPHDRRVDDDPGLGDRPVPRAARALIVTRAARSVERDGRPAVGWIA